MRVNKFEGRFISEKDGIKASISSDQYQCDVCREVVDDAQAIGGYIQRKFHAHTYTIHVCRHHTSDEIIEAIKQIPIQHERWSDGEQPMPHHGEHGWAGMGQN